MKNLLNFEVFEAKKAVKAVKKTDKKSKTDEVDYSDLSWKMDKYMGDDENSQREFYEILDSEESEEDKISELEDFFDNNIQDEERFNRYMPKKGTLKGFCKYLVTRK